MYYYLLINGSLRKVSKKEAIKNNYFFQAVNEKIVSESIKKVFEISHHNCLVEKLEIGKKYFLKLFEYTFIGKIIDNLSLSGSDFLKIEIIKNTLYLYVQHGNIVKHGKFGTDFNFEDRVLGLEKIEKK